MTSLSELKRPALSLLSRTLQVSGCILLSHAAFPLLSYSMTGQWTSTRSLIQKAFATQEYGALIALYLPAMITVLGTATIIASAWDLLLTFIRPKHYAPHTATVHTESDEPDKNDTSIINRH